MSITIQKTFLFLCIALIMYGCSNTGKQEAERVQTINENWLFKKDTTGKDYAIPHYNDNDWEKVWLPHTPEIEPLVVNDQWQGTAWYRKHFTPEKSWDDKKVYIKFEAAMQTAEVWINGKHKTTHYGGYLPFVIDITDELLWNEDNVLAVKLNNEDNPQVPPGKPLEDLDFNMYGGIYRNVHMIVKDKLHITDPVYTQKSGSGGVLVNITDIADQQAIIHVQTHIKNAYEQPMPVTLVNYILNREGDTVAYQQTGGIAIQPGDDHAFMQKFTLRDPMLWHPSNPYLYTVKTVVTGNNGVMDQTKTTMGIRDIELSADGFKLNGKEMFIRGTNRHQEYPYIGYALSDEAQYRDAVKIKNAGFDFVRMAHYPHSKAFMNACDELGLLVMNCIPGWQFFGDETFRQNALQDCRDMIRRDRNHPSVVFWELSLNESGMDDNFMEQTKAIIQEELPYDAINAGWMDHEAYDLYIPARQHAKPPHYWNHYKEGERPVFIAEYGDWEYYAHNAGFNQTAYENLAPEARTSRQLRGYGEKRLLQQALNYQEAFNSNRKGKSTVGDANWLMFDYNRGYDDDIEASGISDIFRIPKFANYFYRSQRPPHEQLPSDLDDGPTVFIASYWNEESATDIRVFSNCDEVALHLNGELIGKQKHDNNRITSHVPSPPFTFELSTFEPGKLEAIGYINRQAVDTHTVVTPGEPYKLQLRYDLSGKKISRTGKDVVFVYASVLDEQGNICPVNDIPVTFSIDGQASLIGKNPIKTEAGIATILLQTLPQADINHLKVGAEGLKGDELELLVK